MNKYFSSTEFIRDYGLIYYHLLNNFRIQLLESGGWKNDSKYSYFQYLEKNAQTISTVKEKSELDQFIDSVTLKDPKSFISIEKLSFVIV